MSTVDVSKIRRLRKASLSQGPSERDFSIPNSDSLGSAMMERPVLQVATDYMGQGTDSHGNLVGLADDAPHFDYEGFRKALEKSDKIMNQQERGRNDSDVLHVPKPEKLERSPSPSNPTFQFHVNAAVHERHPWSKLCNYVASGSWEQLARLPRDTEIYVQWSKWCKKHYSTVEDYIKITVFRFPWVLDPRTNLHSALPWPTDDSEPPTNLFKPNSFPYAVSYGIRHDVLWALSEDYLQPNVVKAVLSWELPLAPPMIVGVDEEDISRRTKSLAFLPKKMRVEYPLAEGVEKQDLTIGADPTPEEISKVPDSAFPFFQSIWFANPPHRKSVRGVPHIQVFSRKIIGKQQRAGVWELIVEGDGLE